MASAKLRITNTTGRVGTVTTTGSIKAIDRAKAGTPAHFPSLDARGSESEIGKGKTMRFQVGQPVKWVSQSGGHIKEKRGVVVYVANPGNSRLTPLHVAAQQFPNHLRMFDGFTWKNGTVLVQVLDGKTEAAKPKLYMPRISALQNDNE